MRHIALFLALLVVAVVAAAQPAAQPQFFIERIDVRNADRVSPDVVIVESRLRAGHTYSELELREASDRVNRLPYLLSADFSLEKGSDRGQHVLVITLNETRVFFFGLDGRIYYVENNPGAAVEYGSDNPGGESNDLAVGWRFFLGRHSAVHFGLQGIGYNTFNSSNTPRTTAFGVGLTQYDLFGTRAFVTLNINKPIHEGDSQITPQLVAGIPLTAKQTLTATYYQLDSSGERSVYKIGSPTPQKFQTSSSNRTLQVTWSYNTTNHPFVPTNGLLLEVTPVGVWGDRAAITYRQIDGNPFYEPVYAVWHANSVGASSTLRRYFEISERNSVSGGISAGWLHTQADVSIEPNQLTYEDRYFGAVTSVSHSLWARERTAKEGDNRIEADLRLHWRRDSGDGFAFLTNPSWDQNGGQTSISWVRRNAWGTWRLGLGYAW